MDASASLNGTTTNCGTRTAMLTACPPPRHALEQALAQSQRAADIIQHLRNFIGKHAPTKTQTDINHLVRRAMELIGPIIEKSAVVVRLDLAEDLPRGHGDGLHIEQGILNLAQNAIEAMLDNGRARRELTIRNSAQ